MYSYWISYRHQLSSSTELSTKVRIQSSRPQWQRSFSHGSCSQEVNSPESLELGTLSQDELFLLCRQTLEKIAIESALDNDSGSFQSVDDL
jgi:hypothetical protein